MKIFKGHFCSPSNPSVQPVRPIKLGASRLAVKVSTGPLRDIVGAESKIKRFAGSPAGFRYTYKVWRKLKDTFDIPSHPTPPHPTPSNKTFGGSQKGKKPSVNRAGFRLSPFCIAYQVFEIFEKSFTHFILSLISVKKISTFGTKYLKSHLNMVISKIVFPKPQLDIKF